MKFLAFCQKTKSVIGSIQSQNLLPYYVPCPACGVKQPVRRVRQLNGDRQVRFSHFFVGAKQRGLLEKLRGLGYEVTLG